MLLDNTAIPSGFSSACNIFLEKYVSLFVIKHSSMINFHSLLYNRTRVTITISKNNIISMPPHSPSSSDIFSKGL